MRNYYVYENNEMPNARYVASGKSRADNRAIAKAIGMGEIVISLSDDSRKHATVLSRIKSHFDCYNAWRKAFETIEDDANVYIEYPIQEHFLQQGRFIRDLTRRGIKVHLIVHDVLLLRDYKRETESPVRKLRMKIEEMLPFKYASTLILLNPKMCDAVEKMGISRNKLYSIGIYDYLFPEYKASAADQNGPVVVAGNLGRHKAGYLYDKDFPDVPLALYGKQYTGKQTSKRKYEGAFPTEELAEHIHGSYGLAWDGDSLVGGCGIYGEYLRINNPHKVSLYLACGLPVIAWDEAAIADLVRETGCGITVHSLRDLKKTLREITPEQYAEMKKNAELMSEKLRRGYYFTHVVRRTAF